jgi:cytochrome P450
LTWFFWELAKHPESAQEIREEIAAVRARIGVRDFSITDLEGMSTMLAAIKVHSGQIRSVFVSLTYPYRSQCGCTLLYGSFPELLLATISSRWHSLS